MSRILVIAADSDLRRSLDFALTAEGHDVTCRASTGAQVLPNAFDCTVLDHHAVGPDLATARTFCRAFAPVILLANLEGHVLSPWAFRTVLKPQLGLALMEAIQEAVGLRGATT
jgi:hypothetical protein